MNYLKKILSALSTVFITSLIIFLLFELLPGDPVLARMGVESDPIVEARLREEFGLSQPVYMRFFKWIYQVLKGNLGNSFSYSNYTVLELIKSRVPTTLTITLGTLLIVLIVSIPLGSLLARKQEKKSFRLLKIFSQVGFSIPSFWVAIILMYIFSLKLKLLPTVGTVNWSRYPITTIKSLVLPILTLSISKVPLVSHYLSNSMLEESHKDYVRVAKSKGLSMDEIFKKHILRNSLISVITIIGMISIYLVTGTIVIENVFALPGLGTLLVEAINRKDYPLVQGIVLYISIAVIFINFIVDIAYSIVDPRIRKRGLKK
ncbi:ABC transporter permease [Cetobacterium sp. SF1]|uniref:ABC transporter permease n=1 Tax=unclassified Cetobacterium TaxID=2630983 RepID=UPI003CF2DA10